MGNCNSRFYDAGSDLWFGDFQEPNYFRIEEAEYYKRALRHERIKAVDYVLCQQDDLGMTVVFIEAKKNLYSTGKGFRNDISDISMQFIDSLHLICGIRLSGKNAKIPLPNGFEQFFQQCGQLVFALVIKNCPIDELEIIEEALSTRLKREKLVWNFKIRVYNEALAIVKNIVVTGAEI